MNKWMIMNDMDESMMIWMMIMMNNKWMDE